MSEHDGLVCSGMKEWVAGAEILGVEDLEGEWHDLHNYHVLLAISWVLPEARVIFRLRPLVNEGESLMIEFTDVSELSATYEDDSPNSPDTFHGMAWRPESGGPSCAWLSRVPIFTSGLERWCFVSERQILLRSERPDRGRASQMGVLKGIAVWGEVVSLPPFELISRKGVDMAQSIPEGTVALIPLGDEPPALAVVARRQPRGHCVALYVYAHVLMNREDSSAALPRPSDATFKGRFSDHAIRSGEWLSQGVHPQFKREQWSFDKIRHKDALSGRCRIVTLDDRNPLKMLSSEDVVCSLVADLPDDSIESPYLFAREVLPRLRLEGSAF